MYRTTAAARRLLLEGQLALAECEHNGVRVDAARLDATIASARADVAEMEKELKADPVYGEWHRAYGDRTNFGSRDQLADVVFGRLGYAAAEYTTGGKTGKVRAKANKANLEIIDLPFVQTYLRMESNKKAIATNLLGIKRELVRGPDGWYIHPSFNLNTVTTFRSSSNMPNWQNFPKRNPDVAAMIRPIFIPRRGHRFAEPDESMVEVRVPAALTGDAELNRYVTDPKSDMHYDTACEALMLARDDIPKPVRQSVKSMVVFATFYGSAFFQCAYRLWQDIDRFGLKTKAGVPLKDHLRSKGITSLGNCDPEVIRTHGTQPGTFVHHMKGVEEKLWRRFAGYKDWKNRMVDKYKREGGLIMVTGFAVNGQLSRNEITNYPIQGPAFHIVLQSLIWIVQWLQKYRMKTLPLGEIHDSIQLDIAPGEEDDVLTYVRYAMTERIRKHWPWITVPLVIEADVSPIDGSWHDCKEWTERNGHWSLKV